VRILLTNNTLDDRAGTELYVRDVATALLARGHSPIAYSTRLGAVAEDLRSATVPVVSRLDGLGEPPDLIHGQHHLETMTALLRFPGVPAAFFCHGWAPWEETPPSFPRIFRYVAVDDTCRDRLISESGVAPEDVEVILNFVDLERFRPRGPLPPRPRRALVFSNRASEATHLPPIREACARAGIDLQVAGASSGGPVARPESLLPTFDLVFAKARSALEALAVGVAVVVADAGGLGSLVTMQNVAGLRRSNFGVRALRRPLDSEAIAREIEGYEPGDAHRVSSWVRAEAGRDRAMDRIVALYGEVLRKSRAAGAVRGEKEAASRYLQWLNGYFKAAQEARVTRHAMEREIAGLREERRSALDDAEALRAERKEGQRLCQEDRAETERVRAELARARGTLTWRAREAVLHMGPAARFYRRLRGLD
jgi:hypothetical protein